MFRRFSKPIGEFVRAARRGESDALEALVLAFQRDAFAVANAHGVRDPDDVVQEAFLAAFTKISTLRDEERFGPWLLEITRNLARRALRRRPVEYTPDIETLSPATPPADEAGDELRETLWGEVDRLPEGVREAIWLYYHEGESTRRVARVLAVSAEVVRKRLQKGRELLRERLYRELGDRLRTGRPSEAEWKKRGRRIALVTFAALPAGLATSNAAQAADLEGASDLSSLGSSTRRALSSATSVPTVLGAIWMTNKLLIALALTLAITAGVGLWFSTQREPELVERDAPVTPPASSGDLDPAPGRLTLASGESSARNAAGSADASSSSSTASGPEASDAKTTVIYRGEIRDAAGAPIEGAVVRWAKVSIESAASWSHDGTWLCDDTELEKLPEERRRLLAAGRATRSKADGSYELEIDHVGWLESARRARVAGKLAKGEVASAVLACASESCVPEIWSLDGSGRPLTPLGTLKAAAVVDLESRESKSTPDVSAVPDAPEFIEKSFRLGFAGRFRGTVLDRASGHPATGMQVVAARIETSDGPQFGVSIPFEDVPTTIVRDDGSYDLLGLEPGDYRVVARSGETDWAAVPTSRAQRVSVEPDGLRDGVDFRVDLGGVVRGVVRSGSGEPVEGATCHVQPRNLASLVVSGHQDSINTFARLSIETDADGRYEFRALDPSIEYLVNVSAETFALGSSDPFSFTDSLLVERDVVLPAGLVIEGVLVDAGGQPVADASVSIVPDLARAMDGLAAAFHHAGVRSDADGRFRIEGLSAEKIDLYAGDKELAQLFSERPATLVTVDLSRGVNVSGVRVVYDAQTTEFLRGRAVDDEGTPLADAEVRAFSNQGFTAMLPGTTRTGEDGTFELAVSAQLARIIVSRAGYNEYRSPVSDISLPIEAVLAKNGAVRGRVVDRSGEPIAVGGTVRVLRGRKDAISELIARVSEGQTTSTSTIGRGGAFVLDVPDEDVELLAVVPGCAPERVAIPRVRSRERREGIEIVVSVGSTAFGRVLREDGRPVEGALIAIDEDSPENETVLRDMMPQVFGAGRKEVLTDAHGEWQIEHLPAARYVFRATPSGDELAASDPVKVTLRKDDEAQVQDLIVPVASRIEGRVVDGEKPAVGWMVQLLGATPMVQAMTDANGAFELRGLRAGEYTVNTLSLESMQAGRFRMKTSPVSVGRAAVAQLEVVFGKGHRVRGTIRGLEPKPFTMVQLRRPGGPDPATTDPLDSKSAVEASSFQAGIAKVAEDGSFEIEDVEPGEYILEVPRMPDDPTDLEAYRTMDRTPLVSKKVTVKDRDLELELRAR